MAGIDIRPVGTDDADRVHYVVSMAFGMQPSPEETERIRQIAEPERSLGAYVDGDLVGHTCIFTLPITVPATRVDSGRLLDTACVSGVGVLPTHRRRGVLSALMRHQLRQLHEEGREPVAALYASEPAIYGRFGYGLASEVAQIDVQRSANALKPLRDAGEPVTLRLVDPLETLEARATLHAELAYARPGMIIRPERWNPYLAADPEQDRNGASPRRCVLAERDGTLVGYACYRTRVSWAPGGPAGTTTVETVTARDMGATVALWRFLLDQDLMATTSVPGIAPDDPLLSLLIDPRRAQIRVNDNLWVRLVDVDRALTARTYSTAVDAVLDVRDEVCPWNAGRWRLRAAPGEAATCERTDAAPDLGVGVTELGSVYLGRPSLARLHAAGLVEEYASGALRQVSDAFGHEPLPWCDTPF